MADRYQPGSSQGEHHIGCYLRGADFDDDGVPTIHPSPSLKMIVQLLVDGRVFVQLGPLADSATEASGAGLGLLDQRTAQRFLVIPRPVSTFLRFPMGRSLWYCNGSTICSRSQIFRTTACHPAAPSCGCLRRFRSTPIQPGSPKCRSTISPPNRGRIGPARWLVNCELLTAQRPTRPRPGVLAVVHHQRPVDGDVVDADRELRRIVERSRRVYRLRVE